MDVSCFGNADPMTLSHVAEVVRGADIGEEIRVLTDIEALISEMRAFAHISGNEVNRVQHRTAITVDLVEHDDHVFVAVPESQRDTGTYWVIVLRVLPTNRLINHSE